MGSYVQSIADIRKESFESGRHSALKDLKEEKEKSRQEAFKEAIEIVGRGSFLSRSEVPEHAKEWSRKILEKLEAAAKGEK